MPSVFIIRSRAVLSRGNAGADESIDRCVAAKGTIPDRGAAGLITKVES